MNQSRDRKGAELEPMIPGDYRSRERAGFQ
jgi:hypothetical protein